MKGVFISLDLDHDEDKKTLLAEQAKLPDSPFEVTDTSVREHLIDNWEAKIRHRIDNTDVVIVLCGEHAFLAEGVAEELTIGQKKKHVMLPFGGLCRHDLHKANISNVIRQGLRVDLGQSEDADRRVEITSHAKNPCSRNQLTLTVPSQTASPSPMSISKVTHSLQ